MRFKYDLHVHTKEISPCARLSIEEIIDKYKQEKYSLLKAEMPEIEWELKLKELKWRHERRTEELKETRRLSVF